MSQALPDISDIKLIRTDTTLDLILDLSLQGAVTIKQPVINSARITWTPIAGKLYHWGWLTQCHVTMLSLRDSPQLRHERPDDHPKLHAFYEGFGKGSRLGERGK